MFLRATLKCFFNKTQKWLNQFTKSMRGDGASLFMMKNQLRVIRYFFFHQLVLSKISLKPIKVKAFELKHALIAHSFSIL